ncbi:Os04g0201500 [Oryza sativa Japonica Group]|uniref:Os04g0201500 protein n=1 Tax=Oryza sativa subsp. japonica TaxID=39947 RepID=A0A0P0W7B0_ORYSJ|nr:hypothetical protein EE612_022477 [Oryza sativa]BAS88069.1 Os04g0201500 [Oryza sativa Japonica Group]
MPFNKHEYHLLQVLLCVFIIVVGLCCAGVGTYSSLSKIIQNYK